MNYYERTPEARKSDIRRAMNYSYRRGRKLRQRIAVNLDRLFLAAAAVLAAVAVIAAWL